MIEIDDKILNALLKIGNHKKVQEICEPHVMQPLKLEPWMVRRTMKAVFLFSQEYEKMKEGKE